MFGAVANAYTLLWTNDLCRELIRGGFTGQRPTALFGGPHQSRPSFRRAGVAPGDRIFAVRAWRTALYPVCSMEVQRIVDYDRAGAELADEDYPKLIHWRPLKSGCLSWGRPAARLGSTGRCPDTTWNTSPSPRDGASGSSSTSRTVGSCGH
jgi:hypothetical protein